VSLGLQQLVDLGATGAVRELLVRLTDDSREREGRGRRVGIRCFTNDMICRT
jgi:hypothetical protein